MSIRLDDFWQLMRSGEDPMAAADRVIESLKAKPESKLTAGDKPGHSFHGNQWGHGTLGTPDKLRRMSDEAKGPRPRGAGDQPGWPEMKQADYDFYVGGGCAAFAGALHGTFGLKIALDMGFNGQVNHAFAYDDDGNAYDAGGRGHLSDFGNESWTARVARDVQPTTLQRMADDNQIQYNAKLVEEAAGIIAKATN